MSFDIQATLSMPISEPVVFTSNELFQATGHVSESMANLVISQFCGAIPVDEDVLHYLKNEERIILTYKNEIHRDFTPIEYWKTLLNDDMINLMLASKYLLNHDLQYTTVWQLCAVTLFLESVTDKNLGEFIEAQEETITSLAQEKDPQKQLILPELVSRKIPRHFREEPLFCSFHQLPKNTVKSITKLTRNEFVTFLETLNDKDTVDKRAVDEAFEVVDQKKNYSYDYPSRNRRYTYILMNSLAINAAEIIERDAEYPFDNSFNTPMLHIAEDEFETFMFKTKNDHLMQIMNNQFVWLIELLRDNQEKFNPTSIYGFVKLLSAPQRLVKNPSAPKKYVRAMNRIREAYETSITEGTEAEFFAKYAYTVDVVAWIRHNTTLILGDQKVKSVPSLGNFQDYDAFADFFLGANENVRSLPLSITLAMHLTEPRKTHYVDAIGSLGAYMHEKVAEAYQDGLYS